MRTRINDAVKAAMKGGDKARLATLRLVTAAIKDRDLAQAAGAEPVGDAEIVAVLQKMVKQRRESIEMYSKGGRQELADAEAAEVAVIEGFLPAQMDEAQLAAAIDAIVAETGAASVKDMGRVMALLRERHAGEVDMGKASGAVKARLSA